MGYSLDWGGWNVPFNQPPGEAPAGLSAAMKVDGSFMAVFSARVPGSERTFLDELWVASGPVGPDGVSWSPWTRVPVPTPFFFRDLGSFVPSATWLEDGTLYLYCLCVQLGRSSGSIFVNSTSSNPIEPSGWSGWTTLSGGGDLPENPSTNVPLYADPSGKLFFVDVDGFVYMSSDQTGGGWTKVSNADPAGSPVVTDARVCATLLGPDEPPALYLFTKHQGNEDIFEITYDESWGNQSASLGDTTMALTAAPVFAETTFTDGAFVFKVGQSNLIYSSYFAPSTPLTLTFDELVQPFQTTMPMSAVTSASEPQRVFLFAMGLNEQIWLNIGTVMVTVPPKTVCEETYTSLMALVARGTVPIAYGTSALNDLWECSGQPNSGVSYAQYKAAWDAVRALGNAWAGHMPPLRPPFEL